MLRQYQQLIESVVNLDQEVNRNEAIVEALTAYVEMELAGENPAQKFPELYQQLTIDADLQETYVALRLILLMEKEQDIVQPTKPLQLNLSFLQKAWSLLSLN